MAEPELINNDRKLSNAQIKATMCSSISASSATGSRSSDEMRNKIEGLLYEIMPSINRPDAERLASQLSTLLRKQSPGISATSPHLKAELKRLSKKILRLATEKRRPSLSLVDATEEASTDSEKAMFPQEMNIDAKVERHHMLINVVGDSAYDEITQVTKEIRDIRRSSALWTKYSHRFVDSLKVEEESIPASKGLPAAIHDIYFRIKLIDVMAVVDAKSSKKFEETPSPCACIVNRVDWEHLLRDAKEKLEAFRKLERENSKSQGEELTFQCSSGLCYRKL